MPDAAPTPSLSGRIALVTGASSGLGWRFAEALAGAGARVVLAARRVQRLERLRDAIAAAGGEALAVAMDVEDAASITASFDAAERAFGAPDVVVANAGMDAAGPALDLPAEDLGRLFRVNVEGVYLTAREAVRRMIASGRSEHGRIVLVGSIAGLRPLAGLTAYSASKAAVAMLGKGLAREWARHGINVNTICPGYVSTEINAGWLDSEPGQRLVRSFPRRRVMQAQELEGLLLFLASDASSAITGGVFAADDGQSLS